MVEIHIENERIGVTRDGERIWFSECYEVVVDIKQFVQLFTNENVTVTEVEEE